MERDRDIDYAAAAVNRALVEKFGRTDDLGQLTVTAHENAIEVHDGKHRCVGSRDDLLAALRKAESYADWWRLAPSE